MLIRIGSHKTITPTNFENRIRAAEVMGIDYLARSPRFLLHKQSGENEWTTTRQRLGV